MNLRNALIPIGVACAFATVGCHWQRSEDRSTFTRSTAPVAASTTTTSARLGLIPITPLNTKIEFTGSTTIKSATGHIEAFDGSLEMTNDDPRTATIRIVLDMNSTTTQIGLLTRHVKGEDFFDVAHYPQSTFTSERISPTSDPGQYQVEGTLEFHGVRKLITFPMSLVVTPNEVKLDASLMIPQSDFGMIEAAHKTKNNVPVRVSMNHQRNGS